MSILGAILGGAAGLIALGGPLGALLGAAAVQGVAFFIWTMDTTHTWCAPESLVQGHAAWHLLGGVASYLLWRYYRGDGPPVAAPAR